MKRLRNKQAYCNNMPTFDAQDKWVERMERHGDMVDKEDLVDRKIYFGNCRNGNLAIWVAELNTFLQPRDKFGNTTLEELPHPRDVKDNFDPFIPHATFEEIMDTPFGLCYLVGERDKDINLKLTKLIEKYKKQKKIIEDQLEDRIAFCKKLRE